MKRNYVDKISLRKSNKSKRSWIAPFAQVFKGLATTYGTAEAEIPEEWLRLVAEKFLSPEEMEKILSAALFTGLTE